MLFDAPALSPIENTAGFDSIDFQDDIHFIRSEPSRKNICIIPLKSCMGKNLLFI